MGERNHDRQLREARTAYVAAVRRLNAALIKFDGCDIPMDPGRGPEPHPWTAEHVRIIRALPGAFEDVITRRREWDGLRREWRDPH